MERRGGVQPRPEDKKNRLRRAAAAREDEARFLTLAEALPAAVILRRGDQMLYANQAATVLTGYPREELLKLAPFAAVHPEDLPLIREITLARQRGEEMPDPPEYRVLTKQGEVRWVERSARRITYAGEPAVVSIVWDITARKRAEEAVKESEEKFRSLAEALPVPILILQGQQVLYANQAVGKMHGIPRNELLKNFWQAIHPDDVPAIRERVASRQRGEAVPANFDVRTVTSAGEERWAECTSCEVTYGGRPARMIVVMDVTDRRRAEQAVRDSEERYRDLFENANDIIYTQDLEGNFTSLNRAAELLTGYSREEASHMNISQVVSPEYLDLARRMTQAKIEQGLPTTTYELEIITKHGRRLTLEVSTRLVRHGDRPVSIQGVARNITERRLLEDRLRQSAKMEAIGQLAGGVAHDFNNLLSLILGHSELLLESLGATDPRRHGVSEIHEAGRRAAALTRQLLAFSRKQVLQPVVLDLNSVVRDTGKLLRRLIGEDIHLQLALPSELGRVKADPGQMEQVLLNLAVNARDAMPKGGRLEISTSHADFSTVFSEGEYQIAPGSYVRLAVSDTGAGMDMATQERIFEPFFTTKGLGKGTGLGLATVYGIVKQSGGHITVISAPGRGATFHIYLPRTTEVQPADPAKEAAAPAPGGREVVLLAEDEPSLRRLVADFLRSNGYRVVEAENGAQAAEMAARHTGPLHLLVTDLVMPRMGGRDLAGQLLARHPNLRVIFLSGYDSEIGHEAAVLEPGTAFLQKPFSLTDLAQKARELLDR